jgi:hypothetical protein
METSRLYFLPLPIFLTLSIALSGCDGGPAAEANITYRQIGICKGFETPAGAMNAASEEGFAVFKIEAVDNTKPSKGFYFDPSLIFVDQSNPEQKAGNVWNWNRRFVSSDARFAKGLGAPVAVQTSVPSGKKAELNSFVFIPIGINNPTEGPADKQFALDLIYDTGSSEKGEEKISEGVAFTKTNSADKVSVVEDCKTISYK